MNLFWFFDIAIKNYVMRYKPSLFIYLAYLYIYVFNANVTFNMYSIPFMHIVQFVIVLCTSHSCCPHTFAILSFFGQQFPFHNRIFAFLGGGVFALSHASMSFCTVCMKKAGIKSKYVAKILVMFWLLLSQPKATQL